MLTFDAARAAAASAPTLPSTRRELHDAVGCVLAEPVTSRLAIPHADTSAMDGWALAAPGDDGGWALLPRHADSPAAPLPPVVTGQAVGVVTGSRIPEGTVSVLRTEHGRAEGLRLSAAPGTGDLEPGRHIRPAGTEARRGEVLVRAGRPLTPARAAAAAVAGFDEVLVVPRPAVRLIMTGPEVLTHGLPAPGQVRDVFGVGLPSMVEDLGGRVLRADRLGDDIEGLAQLLGQAEDADLIITTGGTARSRADTLRPALQRLGAEILVDSVSMRPGHPALLARLGHCRILGVPGNPLAGFAALTALGAPLIDAFRGVPEPTSARILTGRAAADLPGARQGLRLLPVRSLGDQVIGHQDDAGRSPGVEPAGHSNPHMVRGLAAADAFALVGADGVDQGQPVQCLPVPGSGVARI